MNEMGMTIVACGDVHVTLWLHTAANPSDALWCSTLDRIEALKQQLAGDSTRILTLVLSDGGAPNSVQRAQYTDLFEGKSKTVVLTSQLSNPVLRGIATALFWLNPLFKAYRPESFDDALAYLELKDHRQKIITAFQSLQESVGTVNALTVVAGLDHRRQLRPSG